LPWADGTLSMAAFSTKGGEAQAALRMANRKARSSTQLLSDEGTDFLSRLAAVERGESPQKPKRMSTSAADVPDERGNSPANGHSDARTVTRTPDDSPAAVRSRSTHKSQGRLSGKFAALGGDDKLANFLTRMPGMEASAAKAALERFGGNVAMAIHSFEAGGCEEEAAIKEVDPRDQIEDFEEKLRNMQARLADASREALSDALIRTKGHAGRALFLVEKASNVQSKG